MTEIDIDYYGKDTSEAHLVSEIMNLRYLFDIQLEEPGRQLDLYNQAGAINLCVVVI